MKNILTARPEDKNWMDNAGWNLKSLDNHTLTGSFSYCVPLKLLLGFAEDYKRLILNVKQELILLRSSTDKNALFQSAAALTACKISITKIAWRIPYVKVEDEMKLSLLKITDSDRPVKLTFRRWQLHEHPSLPSSKSQT